MWTRGAWLAGVGAATAATAAPDVPADGATRWSFDLALAYDALSFAAPHTPAFSPSATDVTDADRKFSERLPWPQREKMMRIEERYRTTDAGVIAALIEAFDPFAPRTVRDLRRGVRLAAHGAPRPFADSVTDIESLLDALIALDFDGYWTRNVGPRVETRIAEWRAGVGRTDPVSVVSAFMGVSVGPDVTMMLGAFAGGNQRIRDQRFYAYSGLSRRQVLGDVADALMRKTFAATVETDPELNRLADSLRSDTFLQPRVRVFTTVYGGGWRNYVHTCAMEALSILVRERLDTVEETPSRRWRQPYTAEAAFVFAEALYALLRRDRYPAKKHGPFRDTLASYMTGDGPLAPGRIEATYHRLVGEPVIITR